MLGSLPQGLFFWKNDIPEIWRHAHFEKSAILLRFDQNIDLDTQRDSQEALGRPSGGLQEALRRLSGASLSQSVSPRPWDSLGRHFVLKPSCFSAESGATECFACTGAT